VRSIEIPQPDERGFVYRCFEILPGALTWTILLMPIILGFYSPPAAAYFIVGFILLWFLRSISLNYRVLQGYRRMLHYEKTNWPALNQDLEVLTVRAHNPPRWHARNLKRVETNITHDRLLPSQAIHAVLICFWNETRDILEPTIQAVIDSDFDKKQIVLLLAYEQRGGPEVEAMTKSLVKDFGHHFKYIEAVKHPWPMPGEVIGKGGNSTFAGRRLQQIVKEQKIDPNRVVVTVLDSDNRPHKHYFGCLTYTFCSTEEPKYASYQPVPMYTNNIWDAPAPMRVIATGNSFWMVVLSMRQHMLRNFSAHAQPLTALIDTDFWSVRTIVEDGHQFWRTWFRYDGHHEVFPIFLPIYQDAVLTGGGYLHTLKAQFTQIRRWAYGASDVAYVAYTGWFKPNHIPRHKVWAKFLRLLESHISWSTAPLILAFSALIPVFLHPSNFIANELPQVTSKLETLAMVGIAITFFLSMKTLPPRPARYKRRRNFWMVVQWIYLPVTTILYNAAAAINSQTRLMFKWYLDKFDVTEKAVKK